MLSSLGATLNYLLVSLVLLLLAALSAYVSTVCSAHCHKLCMDLSSAMSIHYIFVLNSYSTLYNVLDHLPIHC